MEKRLTLKQMILNKIDDAPRGYAEELAGISFYSNGSNLKKVLREEGREFDKFNGLIELVRFLFKDEEQKIMEQYSKEIDPNNKTARYMLEYLSCNRLLDSMKELIEKMSDCKNKESKEWAKMYSLQLEWQNNYHGLDVPSIMKRLNEFKTTVPELNTLVNIMKCNTFYKNKMYKIAFEYTQDIQFSIEEIKEEYIKSSYTVKFNEIMSYITLRVQNKPEIARSYAEKVLDLNVGKTFNAYAQYIIGYSYFFTSYEKSKEYLTLAAETYKAINRPHAETDVKEELELLDIIWDKDIFSVYLCPKYRYYWWAKNGKHSDIDNNGIESNDPFYFLIKGIQENSTDNLLQSVIRFMKKGDMFLANLPKIELLKRGFNEIVLNDLLSIYNS